MSRIEEIQTKEEQTAATIDKMHSNLTEAEKNCQEWYNKYRYAHNYLL